MYASRLYIIWIDNLKSLVLNIQPHRLILSINVPYGFQFCKGSLLILLHWRMSVIVILNVRQIKEQFCFCNYVHDAFFTYKTFGRQTPFKVLIEQENNTPPLIFQKLLTPTYNFRLIRLILALFRDICIQTDMRHLYYERI